MNEPIIKFTHGENLEGKHVDAIMEYQDLGYAELTCIKFVRPATMLEIAQNCK